MKRNCRMNDLKNTNNNLYQVRISNLKLDDLDSYLEIEFEAFFDKLKFIFSYRKDAAFNIIKSEIYRNIDNRRHYTARLEGKIIGIVEIITTENLKNYIRNFGIYTKYLGFFKACKAFIITSIEIPRLNSSTVYIDTVAVKKTHRRKGIAGKMLSFVEDFAKKNGKSTLKLWVAAKNKNAYSLYKKFGFTGIAKRSSGLAEKYLGYRDWIYMKKEIS